MKQMPQTINKDNLLANLTPHKYAIAKKVQHNILPLFIVFIIIFILSVIYFQIQIFELKKTISSITQVNRLVNPFSQLQYEQCDIKTSSIITSQSHIQFIYKLFGSFQFELSLLYKATFFGDSFEDLSNAVENQSHLLLLIQTTNEEIVGFYSTNAIDNQSGCLKLSEDRECLVFDVNAKEKYTFQYRTRNNPCKGAFSLGNELVLYDHFLSSNENYYNFQRRIEMIR